MSANPEDFVDVGLTPPVFMLRSATIAKLATALAKAQAEMEGATKDSVNPHFKSRYADLAAAWDACRKPLTKHGLAVLQLPRAEGPQVTITTLLTHESGEYIGESLTLTAQQNTPQGIGSAITYGRRYGLMALVGIAPEDDDGEAAEGRNKNGVTVEAPLDPKPTLTTVGPTTIQRVTPKSGTAQGSIVIADGKSYPFYDVQLRGLAEQITQAKESVLIDVRTSEGGRQYVTKLRRTATVDVSDAELDREILAKEAGKIF
jgi:ERF superfamily protein